MENTPENMITQAPQDQNVTPWSVTGEAGEDGKVKAINYDKLVNQFGTNLIDEALLERFQRVTGHEVHRFLRRKIVFSHRDLELILDRYEKKEPFFIYTGRGPSSESMHIGHMVPFELAKWLSDVFEAPLIVMLTDDEKYLTGEMDREINEFEHYAWENAKDIIATGLNPERTFIFSDYAYMGGDFYRNITRIGKRINQGTANACFGFTASTSIAKANFAAVQAASSFANSFPQIFGSSERLSTVSCLIPCAIDQDVYFRVTRDVARQLKYAKPSLILAKFLDALQGPGSKMSASVDSSSIKVRDSPKQISEKINQYAFSGGQQTIEEHREKGGDPEIDVNYQYLKFFLEDDEELEKIRQGYKSGKMLTGELKKKCADELIQFCTTFLERRAKVTEDILGHFMTPRPLLCRGNTISTMLDDDKSELAPIASETNPNSKNQAKRGAKLQAIELKKAQKATKREKGLQKEAKAMVPEHRLVVDGAQKIGGPSSEH